MPNNLISMKEINFIGKSFPANKTIAPGDIFCQFFQNIGEMSSILHS